MRTENLPTERRFQYLCLVLQKDQRRADAGRHIAKNNYEHENMVAAAVATDTHGNKRMDPLLNWTSTIEHYGKTIDPQKLANGGYNVSIVLSAEKQGR